MIGGAAGAVPPLVGYAAATGSLALPALWLFLIVFLWTPPHFWALALMIKEHYANARSPDAPRRARRSRDGEADRLVLARCSSRSRSRSGFWLGPVYTVAAAVLGAVFVLLAWRVLRRLDRPSAVALFHYSLAYLALLFVAAAIDPLVL